MTDDSREEIDLTRLANIFVAGKWWIAATAGLALVIGIAYVSMATKIYRGDMLLQIEARASSLPGISDLIGEEESQTSAEVELLRSRMVLGAVVDRLDLAEPGQRLAAINHLRSGLVITERGGRRGNTGILEVAMEHTDPAHITRVLDTIGQVYVRQNVERRSAEAARSLAFLEAQLPQLREDLELAEEAFNRFRSENQAVDLSEDTRALLGQLVTVEGELKQLRIDEAESALRYGSEHPRMQAMRTRRQSLEETQSAIEKQVGSLPERQQQMLRLQREVEVNNLLYTELLSTAQELRIAQAGTVGNVRVVDSAAVGPRPVHPRTKLALVVSLAAGLGLGMAIVLLRQLLQRGITDPEMLEERLGAPVYAVVPHSATQRHSERQAERHQGRYGVLADVAPNEPTVEALRSLRTSLAFAMMGNARNVISVTSPGPGNGKTFVSVNLAAVLAQSGRRVLVVDTDMRRGYVHRYINRDRSPGLSEILSGTVSVDQAITALRDRVDAIPCGTFPPNPSELLLLPAFGELVESLSRRYDLVLLDTAPLLAVTDGVIVSKHAGPVFLTLRAGETTEREAAAAIKRLAQSGIRASGLVLNDLDSRRDGGEYHYYQYEYK